MSAPAAVPEDERTVAAARRDPHPGSLRLWNVALGLHPWAVTLDVNAADERVRVGTARPSAEALDESERWTVVDLPITALDDVVDGLGDDRRSFCAKVDTEGSAARVLDGGARALTRIDHWALMLEVASLTRGHVATLAERHAAFMMDRRTRRLIRVPGGNAETLESLFAARWLHSRDSLVVSPAVARALEAAP